MEFSIFSAMGADEDKMRAETSFITDMWFRQSRTATDQGEALAVVAKWAKWTPLDRQVVIKGMLALNLVDFLMNQTIDYLNYDMWKTEMEKSLFAPAVTLEIPNSTVIDLSIEAMQTLRPKVTRDMARSGRLPKPQRLLGSLIEKWIPNKDDLKLFFIGWVIYSTVMRLNAAPKKKKGVTEVKGTATEGLCELDQVLGRLNKNKK